MLSLHANHQRKPSGNCFWWNFRRILPSSHFEKFVRRFHPNSQLELEKERFLEYHIIRCYSYTIDIYLDFTYCSFFHYIAQSQMVDQYMIHRQFRLQFSSLTLSLFLGHKFQNTRTMHSSLPRYNRELNKMNIINNLSYLFQEKYNLKTISKSCIKCNVNTHHI